MGGIDEIRKRAAAATPGPWDALRVDSDSGAIDHLVVGSDGGDIATVSEFARPDERSPTRADAAFIAHARADIDWLIHRAERLEEELRRAHVALPHIVRSTPHSCQTEDHCCALHAAHGAAADKVAEWISRAINRADAAGMTSTGMTSEAAAEDKKEARK